MGMGLFRLPILKPFKTFIKPESCYLCVPVVRREDVQKFLKKIPSEGFHIFFDGALVCNSDQTEVIYAQPIEKDLLVEICGLAHSRGLTLELFSKTHFFVECESLLAKVHCELMNFEYHGS